MSSVQYAEKAFLQLIARRTLQATKEAASRGEEYHDLTAPAPLQCGVRAKLKFVEENGEVVQVAVLRKHPSFSSEELAKVAEELLGTPAKLRVGGETDLEYVSASSSEKA